MLGLSTRRIYNYIQEGRLARVRQGKILRVSTEDVATLARRAPGRARTSQPSWHQAPAQNRQYATTITLRLRPGQEHRLEPLLKKIRQENTHRLPGTVARYLLRAHDDPQEITLILMWRAFALPPAEERVAAFAALRADLENTLEWETASIKEGQVLLHA